MKFSNEIFQAKVRTQREELIQVTNTELKKFFEPEEGESADSPCFWKVKQLTAIEISIVNQEIANAKNADSLIENLFSGISKDRIKSIKAIAGIGSTELDEAGEPEVLPDEYVRRMYMTYYGLIDPKPDSIQWVREFARDFPQEFFLISSKIIILTGLGASVGE